MPKILAAILSTCAAYVPEMLLGDRLAGTTGIVVSTVTGLVTYAALLAWLRRLRGDE